MSSKKPSRKGWETAASKAGEGMASEAYGNTVREDNEEDAVRDGGIPPARRSGGKKPDLKTLKSEKAKKSGRKRAAFNQKMADKGKYGYQAEKPKTEDKVNSKSKSRKQKLPDTKSSGEKFGYKGRGSDKEARDNAKGKSKKKANGKYEFKTGKPNTEGMTKTEKAVSKAEYKLEKNADKKEQVKKKLNRTRKYAEKAGIDREFGGKGSKANYEFRLAGEKSPRKERLSAKKKAERKLIYASRDFMHYKVSEDEQDNSSVQGVHAVEKKAEDAFSYFWGKRKTKKERIENRLTKLENRFSRLERKEVRLKADFQYKKYLAENPEAEKKLIQKHLQKLRIKREYAKAARAGESAKEAAVFAQKAAHGTTIIARKIQEAVAKVATSVGSLGIVFILVVIIMAMLGSCTAIIGGSVSTEMAGSYQSLPAEMDASDAQFAELEATLQQQINTVETDHPGYDEYEYNLGEIGHDPFTLMNYLSARYTEFTAAGVSADITEIFGQMYTLSFHEREETREDDDGDEYTVTILETRLVVRPLEEIVVGRLDAEAMLLYNAYLETRGALQDFYSPVDLYWYNYISSYYGQRVHPITGDLQMHRGIDIAVPEGTDLMATHDGRIAEVGNDSGFGIYIVIEDDRGFTTKYGHLKQASVSVGQEVTHGEVIGQTGNTGSSTGPHLHLELLYEGEYYNPLFYFLVGENTLYGEATGGTNPGSGGIDMSDREPFDDETVEALISEAERYLGMPYTFGGTPPSSFDCSAFVCWVFSNSGVHDLPRTTAQGIYDQCGSVSREDAKPGDIIFFTGTYDAGRPVTHVGIYVGDGKMIHCGDPIKYASINTPYWQSHFYGFGRLE